MQGGWTALIIAAANGREEIASELLKAKDINIMQRDIVSLRIQRLGSYCAFCCACINETYM